MDPKLPPIPEELENNILEIPQRDIYLERLDAVLEFVQECTDETGENPWEYFRMHLEHKLIETRLMYQAWSDQGYE
jgi:hypothetical protein